MRELIIHHAETGIGTHLFVLNILVALRINTQSGAVHLFGRKVEPSAHIAALCRRHQHNIFHADFLCQRIPALLCLPGQILYAFTEFVGRCAPEISHADTDSGKHYRHHTCHCE